MHLRIPLPPKQQIKENKTEIKTNASAHSFAPQTTDIRKQNRNQQECICAFPCPPNNRHKKTEQKSKGIHLRIPLPPKQHKKTEQKSTGMHLRIPLPPKQQT